MVLLSLRRVLLRSSIACAPVRTSWLLLLALRPLRPHLLSAPPPLLTPRLLVLLLALRLVWMLAALEPVVVVPMVAPVPVVVFPVVVGLALALLVLGPPLCCLLPPLLLRMGLLRRGPWTLSTPPLGRLLLPPMPAAGSSTHRSGVLHLSRTRCCMVLVPPLPLSLWHLRSIPLRRWLSVHPRRRCLVPLLLLNSFSTAAVRTVPFVMLDL
jgi:hypothetical protein